MPGVSRSVHQERHSGRAQFRGAMFGVARCSKSRKVTRAQGADALRSRDGRAALNYAGGCDLRIKFRLGYVGSGGQRPASLASAIAALKGSVSKEARSSGTSIEAEIDRASCDAQSRACWARSSSPDQWKTQAATQGGYGGKTGGPASIRDRSNVRICSAKATASVKSPCMTRVRAESASMSTMSPENGHSLRTNANASSICASDASSSPRSRSASPRFLSAAARSPACSISRAASSAA